MVSLTYIIDRSRDVFLLIEQLAARCKKKQRKGLTLDADTLAKTQSVYKIVALASKFYKELNNFTPSNADKREARQSVAKDILYNWLPCMD